jgi:hypothetical protein
VHWPPSQIAPGGHCCCGYCCGGYCCGGYCCGGYCCGGYCWYCRCWRRCWRSWSCCRSCCCCRYCWISAAVMQRPAYNHLPCGHQGCALAVSVAARPAPAIAATARIDFTIRFIILLPKPRLLNAGSAFPERATDCRRAAPTGLGNAATTRVATMYSIHRVRMLNLHSFETAFACERWAQGPPFPRGVKVWQGPKCRASSA